MAAWWYADKEKKVGPIEIAEAKRLFQSGKIGLKTVVWCEGMDSWKPLEETELRALKAVLPPPLPPVTAPDVPSVSLATRWPRFLARTFDLSLELPIVCFFVYFLLAISPREFGILTDRPALFWAIAGAVGNGLLMPLALLLDTIVYGVVGNTPGKALLGLHVETVRGERLNVEQYFQRNSAICYRGFWLGIGIPLITLSPYFCNFVFWDADSLPAMTKRLGFKCLRAEQAVPEWSFLVFCSLACSQVHWQFCLPCQSYCDS